MPDSFVDLLLVRLGREEEKKKVLKLLITNLDLSVTDAENAVNNSPSVIKEAVPMNEARIIQKDLYPYIDLLPRLDDEAVSTGEPVETEEPVHADEKQDAPVPESDEEQPEHRPETEAETEAESEADEPAFTPKSNSDFDYEPIVTTTAAEEIVATVRCHICGRTPTDGERLAPCRTCGDLTCRNCFDRTAHVCNHCATEGKTVDRANEGMQAKADEGLEFDSEEPETEDENKKSYAIRIAAAAFLFIAALAAVFYFMDPMNLFDENNSAIVPDDVDITETDSDTPDSMSIDVQSDSMETVAVKIDSTDLLVDTLLLEDPFVVRNISLPESCIPSDQPAEISYRTSLPNGISADIPEDESEILFAQMELLASSIPVELDDGAFVVYHDTTSVLVLVLLHPVDAGLRIKLMRETAAWLIPTEVDQLVLIYRENRYQDAILFSLVRESFPDAEGVLSPRQFQGILGYRDDCWESISGPLAEWLSSIE